MAERAIALLIAAALAASSATAAGGVRVGEPLGVFSSPLFLTGARDGTRDLYVVERGGRVRVAAAGTQAERVFLDVADRITAAGSEQGLLGLAFHPDYAANGRLFVFYTRAGDGSLVVAEHRRAADPRVASSVGADILVVAHPTHTNHNGGMLAFGPDGYLYIGVGDGGAGNDPANHAQNVESLLGKILRIDVDRRDPLGAPYTSPADNPFADGPGRDEIYALGFRNPWRFSFDRATGELWVADVGQGAREEVNAPVMRGGNYGWRVYEGSACTGNDATLCDPSRFLAPRLEYAHAGGRCSITGGHVYRGLRGTLPAGTYVYGDFCTGEVFAWDGTTSSLLLDTSAALASFGEDDDGELYIVDLAGSVSPIEASLPEGTARVFEFHHAAFDHYFMTGRADEQLALDGGRIAGWTRTGQFFDVTVPSTAGRADVHRYFSASFAPKSSHFYTPLVQELEAVNDNVDWQFEGIEFSVALPDAFGSCSAATRPLYRLYNDGRGGAPNHRYTTRIEIRAAMLAQGWIAEGLGALGVIACVL